MYPRNCCRGLHGPGSDRDANIQQGREGIGDSEQGNKEQSTDSGN